MLDKILELRDLAPGVTVDDHRFAGDVQDLVDRVQPGLVPDDRGVRQPLGRRVGKAALPEPVELQGLAVYDHLRSLADDAAQPAVGLHYSGEALA